MFYIYESVSTGIYLYGSLYTTEYLYVLPTLECRSTMSDRESYHRFSRSPTLFLPIVTVFEAETVQYK